MTRRKKIIFLIEMLEKLKTADQEEAEKIFAEIGATSMEILEAVVYYLEGKNA